MSKKPKEVNKEKKMPKFGGFNQRYYPLPDGRELVSVTTVLSILNKPALIQWAANCAVKYIRDCCPPTTNRETGTTYRFATEEQLDLAKTAHRRISKEAADVGTDAHEAILMWLKATKVEGVSEQVGNALNAFIDWWKGHNCKLIANEVVVYGEDYAGRFDLLAEVDGILTLIDIKTSKDFYPEMPLQLAAYRDALKTTLYDVQAMGILRIDKETGIPEYRDFSDGYEKYLEAFMCLVKFFNLTERKDE